MNLEKTEENVRKMVPQDPNDEPATVLLERIKNKDTKQQGSKGSRI